jgi:hypothetical protein
MVQYYSSVCTYLPECVRMELGYYSGDGVERGTRLLNASIDRLNRLKKYIMSRLSGVLSLSVRRPLTD